MAPSAVVIAGHNNTSVNVEGWMRTTTEPAPTACVDLSTFDVPWVVCFLFCYVLFPFWAVHRCRLFGQPLVPFFIFVVLAVACHVDSLLCVCLFMRYSLCHFPSLLCALVCTAYA